MHLDRTLYIDPNVATGFTYTISAGNPNFATVVLPTLQDSEPCKWPSAYVLYAMLAK
jgi:hypothetical protein